MKNNDSFKRLYRYIESWHQPNGYGGYLHHAIHCTVNWSHAQLVPSYTYEPLMNGFITLYNKTDDIEWLKKAEDAAEHLIQIIDCAGQFSYSGFEFAPKGGSIVHTVNPLFAFMKLYELTGDKKYIDVVKSVLKSVVTVFWRGHNFAGPFNMTIIVAACISEYCKVTGDWTLHENYGEPAMSLIKDHQVGAEGGQACGLYYRNEDNHSIIFPWYNTVKATAMLRYGEALEDEEWIQKGRDLLIKLKSLVVDDCMLPHSYLSINGQYKETTAPRLVAPTALLFTQLFAQGLATEEELKRYSSALKEKQKSIGFFPCNEGYGWRSQVGVIAWNAFVFEFLSTQESLKPNESNNFISLWQYNSEFVSIKEDENKLTFDYKGECFVEVTKNTGSIIRHNLKEIDFAIPSKLKQAQVHAIKMNKQRHLGVSYIDESGAGIWLDEDINGTGEIQAWSPFYNISGKQPEEFKNIGKIKYHAFAPYVSKFLKPFVASRTIMNFMGNLLK